MPKSRSKKKSGSSKEEEEGKAVPCMPLNPNPEPLSAYAPNDCVWLFLSERFGWWPATIGEVPKPVSSDTPADSMRQRYIQRLKDEGKKVPEVPDLSGLALETDDHSRLRQRLQAEGETKGKEASAGTSEQLRRAAAIPKWTEGAAARKEQGEPSGADNKENSDGNVAKEPEKEKEQKPDQAPRAGIPVRFMDDENYEFTMVTDPSFLRRYKCDERSDLVREGIHRFDPQNYKPIKQKKGYNDAIEAAESKQNSFFKEVETFELLTDTGDENIVNLISQYVNLDATPAELEALEEARRQQRSKARAKPRPKSRGGGSKGRSSSASSSSSSAGNKRKAASAPAPEPANKRRAGTRSSRRSK